MYSPIWKIDEILSMTEFGGKIGWFYGFVWYENELYFGEIFPGLGFTKGTGIWYPEDGKPVRGVFLVLSRMVKDVIWATKMRKRYHEEKGSGSTKA